MHRRHVLGAMIAASLVRPALAAPTARELAPTPTFKRFYADNIYGQMHVRYVKPSTATTKPPLMCLHASPLSSVVYENWIEEMGKDRLAFAPDTPGYGSSDGPPQQVEIGDFAKCFIRLLDELSLKTVDVMGYHTGSMTAVELAKQYPARIRKVVMISAPIFNADELAKLRASNGGPAPDWETTLARALEAWRKNPRGMFRDVPTDDRYVDISIERMRRFRTGPWGFRAAFNYDLQAAMGEIKQPVLLLNPEDDLWEMTPRAMKTAKTATLKNLPGWTHGHLDSHTAEMAAMVRGFLDT